MSSRSSVVRTAHQSGGFDNRRTAPDEKAGTRAEGEGREEPRRSRGLKGLGAGATLAVAKAARNRAHASK
jgi:hypothetical protein